MGGREKEKDGDQNFGLWAEGQDVSEGRSLRGRSLRGGFCVRMPGNRFESIFDLCLPWSVPCPFLASYSSHLPMSLGFNSCAQVSLLFPHLSVSFQRFLLSFVLVSCTLGLPAHCSAILTFLPSSPSIPTLSPVSTQFTGLVQQFSTQTLVLPPFAACGVPSVSIPLSSL